MVLEPHTARGRVLRFLGSGEVCSDHLTLLAADRAEAAVASHVADWLARESRRQWDTLELVGLDAGDVTIDLLADHLEVHGYDVHRRRGVNCWRVEFPDTWDEYVASLSKSRRERVHKLLRRNFDTGQVSTGMVENADELEPYFRRLVELHQKRRASLGQPGCFASARFTAFHRDVMAQLLSLGLLRLWWTDLDGRPAAIEYDLIGGDTIYFYQSGIEPELADDRPGWLGSIGSLRDTQRRGFRYFDFLRGDEAYKSSWRATMQPAEEVRIVAPRSIPRLRYATWSTGQLLRRWAKIGRRKAARPKTNPPRTARVRQ